MNIMLELPQNINLLSSVHIFSKYKNKLTTFFTTGDDRTNPARYHPFYITDSKEGGYGQKSEEEQKHQRVFAGVSYDAEGYPYPTAGKAF